MKTNALISSMTVGTIFLAASAIAQESVQRSELKKEEVPQAVLQTFEKQHPHLKGVTYEQEIRQGAPYYGMEIKTKGKEEEFIYSADGTLVEQHEPVSLKNVPAVVREAVKRDYPKAAITEAEKVVNPDKTVVGYEMDIKEGKKRSELVFDPSGKLLRQETI